MLSFHRFDPVPCGFPAPRVRVLPSLRVASLRLRANRVEPQARWFRRGRYALAAACRLAGVGRDGSLLAPAYHCRTMLDPAIALGAPVLLYRLQPDLAPDIESIDEQMRSAAVPVKALLVPHYFGFRQALGDLVALCRQHGAQLIEDCSHALAGLGAGDGERVPLGATGDYAIASPYKFLPTPDGGLLWSASRHLHGARAAMPRAAEQLRAVVDAAVAVVGRAPLPSVADLPRELGRLRSAPAPAAREWVEVEEHPSALYASPLEGSSCLAATRWIARHADLDRVAARRRRHFRRWLAAMEGVPACRPLFADLPEDCVPYMFPLLIDRPQTDFALLKRLGVPIWRWDEMATSTCAVALRYRQQLLHLPCHQELADAEVDWMAAAVAAVCGGPASGVPHVA